MPHYNLTAVRAQITEQIAADTLLDVDRIRMGTPSKFITAYRRFDPLRIDFIVEAMKIENDGLGRDEAMVAAARCLGELVGSFSLSCVGERERSLFKGSFDRALSETIIGPVDPEQTGVSSTFKAEEGGHA